MFCKISTNSRWNLLLYSLRSIFNYLFIFKCIQYSHYEDISDIGILFEFYTASGMKKNWKLLKIISQYQICLAKDYFKSLKNEIFEIFLFCIISKHFIVTDLFGNILVNLFNLFEWYHRSVCLSFINWPVNFMTWYCLFWSSLICTVV